MGGTKPTGVAVRARRSAARKASRVRTTSTEAWRGAGGGAGSVTSGNTGSGGPRATSTGCGTSGVTPSSTTFGPGGMGGSSSGTIGTTGIGGRGGGRGSGTGGRGGAPSRDGGPPPPIDAGVNNPILSILPGVRPTPQCNQCVDVRCNSTTACSIDPQCLAGTQCYFAACASLPGQNQQLPFALKCF